LRDYFNILRCHRKIIRAVHHQLPDLLGKLDICGRIALVDGGLIDPVSVPRIILTIVGGI
jgi:hypothetical protein